MRIPTGAPRLTPAEELALSAVGLERLQASGAPPERWRVPGFGRAVDTVRAQLAPIASREMLALSFSREVRAPAGRAGGEPLLPDRRLASDPVLVAYVVRWIELGDGAPRPRFAVLTIVAAGPSDDLAETAPRVPRAGSPVDPPAVRSLGT